MLNEGKYFLLGPSSSGKHENARRLSRKNTRVHHTFDFIYRVLFFFFADAHPRISPSSSGDSGVAPISVAVV